MKVDRVISFDWLLFIGETVTAAIVFAMINEESIRRDRGKRDRKCDDHTDQVDRSYTVP